MYINSLKNPDDEEQGPQPTTMKAQAARMAASVVPTTNLQSKPSGSASASTGAPQGAPMAHASSVGPTAPTTPAAPAAPTSAPTTTARALSTPTTPTPPNPGWVNMDSVAAGQNVAKDPQQAASNDPNFDAIVQQIMTNANNAKVDPAADMALAKHQSQVDNANMMARMGASGFGTSGAAAALSGNINTDMLRQLASLQNTAATTNAGLQQNAFNDIMTYQNSEKADAARKAAIDAANIDAGGFVDKDHNGTDDTTGLGKDAYDLGFQVSNTSATPANEGAYNAINWMFTPGSDQRPFQMSPAQAAQAKHSGWTVKQGGLYGHQMMYQDPVNGMWYVETT